MSRAAQGNVFLVGSGALADSLAKLLGTLVSERATCEQGPARARTLAPNLIVLAGDAASDRGAALLERLAQNPEPLIPVIVICAPALASAIPQITPRHVALVTPEGGMNECARRVRSVLELFVDEGLTDCSLQQLADTVAAATRPKISNATGPIPQFNVTQPMSQLTVKRTPTVSSPTFSAPTATTKSPGMPALKFPARPVAPGAIREVTAAAPNTQLSAAKPPEVATQPRLIKGIVAAASPSASPAQPMQRALLHEAGPPALPLTAAVTSKAELSLPAGAIAAKTPTITVAHARVAPEPAAAQTPKAAEPAPAAPQLPAGMSTSKKPATATASAQAATQPTRRTAFGIAPPSAAASTSTQDQVAPARREPPPLAIKAQTAEAPAKPSIVSLISAAPRELEANAAPQQAAAVSGERAQPPVAVTLSTRPTSPPTADEASAAATSVASSGSDRTTDPPKLQASFFTANAGPARVVSAKHTPVAAPAKASAPQSDPRSVTNPALRQRVANPLEPAPAPVQRSLVTLDRDKTAPRKPSAIAVAEIPDITVSFSEPPAPAQPSRGPAPTRKPRRAVNPFDAAPRPQQAPRPKVAQAHVGTPGTPAQTERSKSVPPAPALAAEAPQLSPKPRSRKLVPWLCLAAAIGCGIVLFELLSGTSHNSKDSGAALGALQRGENLPLPNPPIARAPIPTQAASSPSSTAPAPATQSKEMTAAVSATGAAPSARKPAQEHEPVNEPGSAAALVDEGLALFKDKRLGLAEASYLKALKLQPGYPRAMAALVRVHIERRDGAEAVRWAKQLVEAQPENGAYLLLLGDAQKIRGDLAAARDAWTEAADNGNATARERL